MSRDVHNGPTDEFAQARGTAYSHDAEPDEAPALLKLALDGWHRARGGRERELRNFDHLHAAHRLVHD